MSHHSQAIIDITGQFSAIRGVKPGEDGLAGLDLAPILTRLLDGLINRCFPGEDNQAIAEALISPKSAQSAAFARACRREANREIKRPPHRNPTGRRISARERNKLREELAADLRLSMQSTAETKGIHGVTELVEELRR